MGLGMAQQRRASLPGFMVVLRSELGGPKPDVIVHSGDECDALYIAFDLP